MNKNENDNNKKSISISYIVFAFIFTIVFLYYFNSIFIDIYQSRIPTLKTCGLFETKDFSTGGDKFNQDVWAKIQCENGDIYSCSTICLNKSKVSDRCLESVYKCTKG